MWFKLFKRSKKFFLDCLDKKLDSSSLLRKKTKNKRNPFYETSYDTLEKNGGVFHYMIQTIRPFIFMKSMVR